ncbi:MAG: Hint domain-containing protein [Clostridiaceae bacterium]|nr:Hint domain-containing protein [Clostridiaceae bacterium]
MKSFQQHCVKGDCLACDTIITLDYGEQKRADDIRIGDRVCTRNGRATVGDIIQGTEGDILKITTEQGSISLTATHPLLTPKGRITAGEVKVGDTLLTDSGSAVVASAVVETYNQRVFSFMLEDSEDTGMFFLANKFWVGDFYAQNSMPRENSPGKERAIIVEATRLMEELKRGI